MKIELNNQKIKQIILEKDIPIQSISDKSHISRAQVYNIINGKHEQIHERTAFKLASILKCNISDFAIKIAK